MRGFFNKFVLTVVSVLLLAVSAHADETKLDIVYDYNNSKIIIGGEIESKDGFASIQIFKPGKNIESFEDTDVFYRNQVKITNKSFLFDVGYELSQGESETYKAYIITSQDDEIDEIELFVVPYADYEKFYNDLASSIKNSDKDAFISIVNLNRKLAGFDNKLTKGKNLTSYLDNFYLYVKNNGITKENNDENRRMFLSHVIAVALNRCEIENVHLYVGDLIIFDNELESKYKDIVKGVDEQMYLTRKLSDRSITDMKNFEKEFKQALTLTGIKYADGYGEVKELLDLYGKYFGITKSAENSVYKALCGNDYTAENLPSVFENFVNGQDRRPSGSSGGGGGGGKNTLSTAPGGNSYAQDIINDNEDMERIPLMFEDIEGVPWASEAILALADKKIINGKEVGKFKPDDKISREEFVKILVCAMGYENCEFNNTGFKDVKQDDWFYKYVNIAANSGIVNGVGNNQFGTGTLITRQDLVTMIYNVLVMKNVQVDTTIPEFNDINETSSYAVNAVSALYNMGIVNGVGDAQFAPMKNATRAEAAKIIYGVLNLLI